MKNETSTFREFTQQIPCLLTASKYCCFIIIFILLTGCSETDRHKPAAVKGVIDFTDFSFSEQGVADLDGEWEFYWKKLLTPEELNKIPADLPKQYAAVPATWRELSVKGFDTDAKGYATYRLKVLVPDSGAVYGLHVFSLISAYKIWAGGVPVAEAGRVGITDETMVHRWVPGEFYFRVPAGETDIVIQISNYRCDLGGFWTPAGFGRAEDISSQRRLKISFDNFLLGILVILAFYHVGFHLFRKKERTSLWFGLFCIIMVMRILSLGEQRILYQVPGLSWDIAYRIELLSFYIAGGVFYFFLRSIYPGESSRVLEKITALAVPFTVVITGILPTFILGRIINLFIFITVFYITAAVNVLFNALRKRREGSLIFMVGIISLLVPAINDIMNLLEFLHTGFYVPVGFMVFVMAQSLIMLRKFSMSFVNAENLTRELEVINETLEQKVEERTRELENERNILKDQGQVMDDELKMARSIQRGIIPVRAPFDNIAFYYRPMNRVGGDFFDFIKMREDSTGILISDVSGHGVPAALITSMLKSFVLQSGKKKQSPEQLMTYLNDSLIDHTAGNFITAFYCIYSPGEKKLVYCNAGHPLPYIISDSGIRNISPVNRNIPLAVFRSDELREYDKRYCSSTVTLNHGDRLLLYTDGLIEARTGRYSEQMFGNSELETVLYMNRGLPVDKFLTMINSKLTEYCGSENIEDDICMVCIDI